MAITVWTKWKRSRTEKTDRTKFEEGFATWLPSPLTESQIAAAVSHWPETLVVAGAGSGKTTLLLGRAKYLVESGRVQPGRTLALAFNRSAAEELTERALRADVDLKAMTFHGYGNSVLNQDARVGGVAFGEEQDVTKFFMNQISASISLDPKRLLIRFFSEMLVPFREQSAFATMADYAAFARAIPLTLSNTRVKSHGEFVIANYLFARAFVLSTRQSTKEVNEASGTGPILRSLVRRIRRSTSNTSELTPMATLLPSLTEISTTGTWTGSDALT